MHRSRNSPYLLIVAGLTLLFLSPTPLASYQWSQDQLSISPLPHDIERISPILRADLNADQIPEEVTLHSGEASVQQSGKAIWSSPPGWEVLQAEVTDLNRDGIAEIALLIWRDFAPWPIDAWLAYPGRIDTFHDRRNRSCHLILIGWRFGHFTEVWAGSALADPISAFRAVDLDGDGNQELVALESRYDQPRDTAHAVTVWEWNGFGFTLLSRQPEGRFRGFRIAKKNEGTPFILLEGTTRR